MSPMTIIGIALGVGAVVYALSLRTGAEQVVPFDPAAEGAGPLSEPRRWWKRPSREPQTLTFVPEPSPPPEDPSGFVYVPVLAAAGAGWRRRLAGLAGLIVLVVFASFALAFGVYQVGHLLNETIERFLGR